MQALSLAQRNKQHFHRADFRAKKDYDSLRNCKRWQSVRLKVLTDSAVCKNPFSVHKFDILAKEVHHIVPLHIDKSLAYVMSNLVGLCQSCHARCDALARVDLDKQKRLFLKSLKDGFRIDVNKK